MNNKPLINKQNYFKRRMKLAFKRRKALVRDGASVLPHLFTLGNAFFGFVSIVFASRGAYEAACYSIFLAALMDSLDGRVARYLGACSELGLQLDSLADATSFCLAPAFLVFSSHLYKLDFIGLFIVTIFLGAGLFRLARFNLISAEQSAFFLGIPTTFSGCFLASLILNVNHIKIYKFTYLLAAMTFILAFLMISHLKFPTFKKKIFLFKRKWQRNIFTTIFAIFVVLRFDLFLLLFLSLYLIGSIIYAFILKIKYSNSNDSKELDINKNIDNKNNI